jgi:hypothetical protein
VVFPDFQFLNSTPAGVFGVSLDCSFTYYQHLIVRFTKQIREPYLIRVDNIETDPQSNELLVSFPVANKRVNQDMPVAEFVKTDMIYLVDPRAVFYKGQQYGCHTEN